MASDKISEDIKRDMTSLGVKLRPTSLEEVVGQKTTLKILKSQIENESFKNSLFAGATGCGKTSVARLVGKYTDAEIREVDAASNNGVDNIRAICEDAYERSLTNKYKLIILDEAHMLTTQAWNAFLKMVEEPPRYTFFILCTTDPQKIPETILNRVQRFNFTRISEEDMRAKLAETCNKESFNYTPEALDYIVKLANGSLREALSILGQAADLSNGISLENLVSIYGDYTYDTFTKLTNFLLDGDEAGVIALVDKLYDRGINLKVFINKYVEFCLDVLKHILFETEDQYSRYIKDIINFENPKNYYNYLIDKLLDLKNMIKEDLDYKTTIEAVLLRIARCE